VLSLRRPFVHGTTLNLNEVSSLDAGGLGAFVELDNEARAGGKQMRRRNVPARVTRLPAVASPLRPVASEPGSALRETPAVERGRSRTGECS
jgi:hypothetical protein